MDRWTPSSWRRFPARQLPSYPDVHRLAAVEGRLRSAAPVVALSDCAALRSALADPQRFLLQGGDCAESFDDPVAERVAALSDLFDAMLDALRPVLAAEPVAVARVAGQFAKPRSAEIEDRDGILLPAYRGDIINDARFDATARRPDPERMLRAHLQSIGAAASLAAARGGEAPLFTSHEALLLPYEEALVRQGPDGRHWATSAHMVWLGDRTRQVDGAHVAFAAGIANSVGVKCGPTMDGDELVRLAGRLDPANEAGKLVFIGRFGADRIERALPPLLRAARREGLAARWTIDPMHGNTHSLAGRKVRRLADILAEIDLFFALCAAEGVKPGGVHLEMSALDVTECLGGSGPASLGELDRNWRSVCDPRLNRAQATDVARHVASLIASARVSA